MSTVSDIDTLLQQGQKTKALALAQRLARRRPKDPSTLDALARSFIAVEKFKQAVATFDRLAKLSPKNAKPLADKALLLQQMGDMDAANQALRRALRLDPLNGSLLRMLSASSRLEPDDPDVSRFLDVWDSGGLAQDDQAEAGFALAKVLGKPGFRYLEKANALLDAMHPFDLGNRGDEIASLKRSFASNPWQVPSAFPDASQRPIFVTGLPRSGTTLVEQILGTHSQVQVAGETGLPLRAAYSVLWNAGTVRMMNKLSGTELATIASRYLEGMVHFHQVSGVFTDKSIQTVLVAGVFKHVLPSARCILVRRDPRDIGWSIYRNHFAAGTHTYSNNLRNIADYIRSTEEILTFWRKEMPDAFLEVRYEDLVTNPEPEIRRILGYCDLPWEEDCLFPEKSRAMVKTLSIEQVRSPISPKSIGGWRAYADELAPLIEALGDLSAPWD